MEAQVNVDVMTAVSRGAIWRPRVVETHPIKEQIVARPLRSADHVAIEVDKLLEDVRRSIGCDMDAATRAVGRLAALLASAVPQDLRAVPSPRGLAPWQKRKIQSYIEDRLGGPLR